MKTKIEPRLSNQHAISSFIAPFCVFLLSLSAFSFLLATPALAVSQSINYQGLLANSAGNPVSDGPHTLTFRIYTALSGGSFLTQESKSVTTQDGIFSTTINVSGISFASNAYYLGVEVATDGEMTPRKLLGSVPQAIMSSALDDSTADTGYIDIQGDATIGGNVGIGMTASVGKLDILGTIQQSYTGQVNIFSSTDQQSTLGLLRASDQGGFLIGRDAGNNGTHDFFIYDTDSSAFRVFINAAGNVGIGNTTPTAALSIAGFTDRYGIYSETNNEADGGLMHLYRPAEDTHLWVSAVDSDRISFGTNKGMAFYIGAESGYSGIEALRIDNSGNVGIGTTTPDPSAKLHVMGDFDVGGTDVGTDTDRPTIQVEGLYPNVIIKSQGNTQHGSTLGLWSFDGDATTHQWNVGGGQNGRFSIGYAINDSNPHAGIDGYGSGATRLLIDTDGKVGIGTIYPTEGLTIVDAGNINRFSGTLAVYANNFSQGVSIGFEGISKVGSNGNGNLYLDAQGTGNLILQSQATGNVGIGIISPFKKLTLPSGEGYDGLIAWEASSYDGNSRRWWMGSDQEVYGDFAIMTESSQAQGDNPDIKNRFYISPSGNVGIGTTSPFGKFDVRGNVCISDDGGAACSQGYMANGSLTVGSYNSSFGGGNSWNGNTAGLMLETDSNTEIMIHDVGTRLTSFMYYEGESNNRITIGRDAGWGVLNELILNGNVGIGTDNPTSPLTINKTFTADQVAYAQEINLTADLVNGFSNDIYAAKNTVTVPADNSNDLSGGYIYGVGASAIHQGTSNLFSASGLSGNAENSGGARVEYLSGGDLTSNIIGSDVGTADGVFPQVWNMSNDANSSSVEYAYGSYANISNVVGSSGNATINNAYGYYYQLGNYDSGAGSASIGNAYGVFVDTPNTSGGTIADNYGVYINNQTGGVNNYALYSAGGKSYFADDVGIGTIAPGAELEVAGDIIASGIITSAFPSIGSPTYGTVNDFLNFAGTAGRATGGTINDAGSGNITVDAGTGYIRIGATNISELKAFDWSALGATAIPADTVRYVGINYNSGSPVVEVRTLDNWNYYDNWPLGMVANAGGTIHINQDGREFPDQVGRLIRRFYGTRPYERDERQGGLIIGETGTRNVTLTAGTLWDRSNNFTIPSFDSSGTDRFDVYYRDGSGGWTGVLNQSQWPNTQYDNNSGTLQTATNAKWLALWFYLETDGNIVMLYGQNQYNTQALAAASTAPSSVPARITASGRLIGRFLFQKSDPTAIIETVWNSTLNPTLVADHGSLAGLADDDHTQYMLLAGRAGGQALIGGTGTTDDLIMRTTSGVGVSGADMIFQTGSDGGTEAMRILYDGKIGIGDTTPAYGSLVVANGIVIGSDADQNALIDDATNGSGSTVLYIGQNTIDTTAPSDERLK
ncbi:hypothetical protein EPO05_02505, partial [Patescibacteria group bacterium]